MEKAKVAIGIVARWDDVLIVERTKNDGVNKSFPSGNVEPGEEIEDAAIREVVEETSVETTYNKYLGSRPHPFSPDKELCYCLLWYVSGEPDCSNDKNISRTWRVKKSELEEHLGTNIFGPVKEALNLPQNGKN